MLQLQAISCKIQAAISDNEKSPALCSFGIVTFWGPQVQLLTNIVKDTNQNLYLLVTATSLAPTLPLIGSVRANSAHPENRYIIFSYNFCYVGASRTTDVTKIRINSDT